MEANGHIESKYIGTLVNRQRFRFVHYVKLKDKEYLLFVQKALSIFYSELLWKKVHDFL